jgi:hypothetical protein
MSELNRKEWYLPDRATLETIGPLRTEEVLKRISSGTLRVDEYIWSPSFGDKQWRRISELPELSGAMLQAPKLAIPSRSRGKAAVILPSQVRFETEGYFGEDNLYRRFPRARLVAEAIVHNHRVYRKFKTSDISEKGVFVQTEELTAFERGEELVITVRSSREGDGIVFSAPAVVMRVLSEAGRRGFGLYFTRISPQTRRKIARYVLEHINDVDESGTTAEGVQTAA